jgi:hypothetical protein
VRRVIVSMWMRTCYSVAALWLLYREKKVQMRARRHLVASLLTHVFAVSACAPVAHMPSFALPTRAAAQVSPSAASATATFTPFPSGSAGAITGSSLMYPADTMPALAIYALSTTDPSQFFFARTQAGELSQNQQRGARNVRRDRVSGKWTRS